MTGVCYFLFLIVFCFVFCYFFIFFRFLNLCFLTFYFSWFCLTGNTIDRTLLLLLTCPVYRGILVMLYVRVYNSCLFFLMYHGLCNFKCSEFPWLLREACIEELHMKSTIWCVLSTHASYKVLYENFLGLSAQDSGFHHAKPALPNHRMGSTILQSL